MPAIIGLTAQEARKRLERFGKNEVIIPKKINPISIFIAQFKSFLVLILVLAAILSLLSSYFSKSKDFLDAIFIFVIIFLNAILGFVQEYKAEKAIAALKKMVVEKVRVIRAGKEEEIDVKELVWGDIFILEEGQKIPADGRLLEAVSIETNEASLTGESNPVEKEVQVGREVEDKNLVFAGTICEKGFGRVEVLATGLSTRFGKIAKLLQTIEDEPTPLQEKLTVLARQLGFLGLFAALVVVFLGIIYGKEIFEMLLTGASLAVAIVPEGLPAVVTITLAIGVQRMAKVSSLIRKLSSIEAIGSVDVICSDKTGTITENEMVVKRIFYNNSISDREGQEKLKESYELNKISEIGILCSTTSLGKEGGKTVILGNRTEGSILLFSQDLGQNLEKIRQEGRTLQQFSFDPRIKMMSILYEYPSKKLEVLTKGAAEIVLSKSKKILLEGKITELSLSQRRKIENYIKKEASLGFRLLAFAFKDIKKLSTGRDEAESDLVFVGFVSIFDPPRKGVKEAIKLAQKAGIRVLMITGDNPLTAWAISKDVGLFQGNEGKVKTGQELDQMNDKEFAKTVKQVDVFARVTPQHKFRIVKTLQNLGLTVGVTGDGVNDAPALKQADVGMAMGVIGTDVAKEAADMVIADDNFSSIIKAVEEGRVVYENILKSIRYLLSCNSGELLAILGAVSIGLPSPLTPIQILWMNLVTDGLPALALAQDPRNPHVMQKPPRGKSVSILETAGKLWILLIGLSLGLITLISFTFLDFGASLDEARTVAFSILVLGEMVVAFLVRKRESLFSNRFLILAVFLTLLLQVLIITLPFLRPIFDTRFPF